MIVVESFQWRKEERRARHGDIDIGGRWGIESFSKNKHVSISGEKKELLEKV